MCFIHKLQTEQNYYFTDYSINIILHKYKCLVKYIIIIDYIEFSSTFF